MAYWRRHPPLHLMVASYLGFKSEDETEDQEISEEEYMRLLKEVQMQFIKS